jgi:hypothetical protein
VAEKVSLQFQPEKASASLFSPAYCIRRSAIFSYDHLLRWRSALNDLSADTRLSIDPRLLSSRTERRIHTVAIYGSLALIAAVVFGTLSVHPF